MARFEIDVNQFERLQKAIKDYPNNAEEAINEVLHNEGSQLIQEEVRQLMPFSGKNWRGKPSPAKTSKSTMDVKGNLFVEVKSSKRYGYLYYPDDGTTTRRHVGNQQFFYRGAENKQDEIIDRCVDRLVSEFEN